MSTAAPREYAGPVSRAVAYLLDAFLVAALCTGTAAVAAMIISVMGGRLDDVTPAVASACTVVLPVSMATYCAVFWALAGRTPGMAVLGLRVVTMRRHHLSWRAALLRALVLAFFPVGAVWALVDRRHQAVHDKVAGTAVVQAPSARPVPSAAR
jgi:uncharacterized RDD family membrane protein YckC